MADANIGFWDTDEKDRPYNAMQISAFTSGIEINVSNEWESANIKLTNEQIDEFLQWLSSIRKMSARE